jgi:hypothetical protein
MTEISKTVRLRIAKWYAKNMLQIEPGFNVHLEKWNQEDNECTMTITCFDDYPFPQFRRDKDDLESYLVRKFGSMIIEDKRKPTNMDLSASSKGLPLTHPVIRHDKKEFPSLADSYDEEYILEITKPQLLEANGTLGRGRLKPDTIKQTSSYTPDICRLRMGKWQ